MQTPTDNPAREVPADGKIYLILGCMFCFKTSELIKIYRRKKIAGSQCLLIKYSRDTRYDDKESSKETHFLSTHDGLKIEAIATERLSDLNINPYDYDDIFIDEIQFYPDKVEFCDTMANHGVNIYASGLSGDYQRKPFAGMAELIAIAYDIKFLTAVCDICHRDNMACYSKRLSKSDGIILIGGHDSYQAVCRACYAIQ